MWDIWLNLTLAATATGANTYAIRRGSPDLAGLRASVAALSAFYVGGYAWLLTGAVNRTTWSQTFSKVAILAWVLVWIAPPILAARAHTRMKRTIKERLTPDEESP